MVQNEGKSKGGVSIFRNSVEFYFAIDPLKFALAHSSMCSYPYGHELKPQSPISMGFTGTVTSLHCLHHHIFFFFFRNKKGTEILGEKVLCITLFWAVIIPWDAD